MLTVFSISWFAVAFDMPFLVWSLKELVNAWQLQSCMSRMME